MINTKGQKAEVSHSPLVTSGHLLGAVTWYTHDTLNHTPNPKPVSANEVSALNVYVAICPHIDPPPFSHYFQIQLQGVWGHTHTYTRTHVQKSRKMGYVMSDGYGIILL